MGNLGFLFNVETKNSFIKKDFIVVFTKSSKFVGNIILGFENSLKKDLTQFYYLGDDLSFVDFIILEDTKLMYSKISVYSHIQLDFRDFLFRFDPKRYKKLYDNLHIIKELNSNQELIERINDIIKYFV